MNNFIKQAVRLFLSGGVCRARGPANTPNFISIYGPRCWKLPGTLDVVALVTVLKREPKCAAFRGTHHPR
jgi:hypothetical protein